MAMEITMRMHGALDDIGERVARRAWSSLTHLPGMERLYPGYYVSIERAAEEYLWRRLTADIACQDGCRRLLFDGPESVEEFELRMADEIAHHLERLVVDRGNLSAVREALPQAVHQALAEYVPADVAQGGHA